MLASFNTLSRSYSTFYKSKYKDSSSLHQVISGDTVRLGYSFNIIANANTNSPCHYVMLCGSSNKVLSSYFNMSMLFTDIDNLFKIKSDRDCLAFQL